MVWVIEVDSKTIQHHLKDQGYQLHIPVHLVPVAVQQVAAVEVLMSRGKVLPISPWWFQMMSSLMTHIRSYPQMISSQFLPSQERISKGSTKVIFYHLR